MVDNGTLYTMENGRPKPLSNLQLYCWLCVARGGYARGVSPRWLRQRAVDRMAEWDGDTGSQLMSQPFAFETQESQSQQVKLSPLECSCHAFSHCFALVRRTPGVTSSPARIADPLCGR